MDLSNTSRQEFEERYSSLNGCTQGGGWNDYDIPNQRYHEVDTQDAWDLWQAAHLSCASKLKSAHGRIIELESLLNQGQGEFIETDWAIQYKAADGSRTSWMNSSGYTTLYGTKERATLDCLTQEYEPRQVALYSVPSKAAPISPQNLSEATFRQFLVDVKYRLEKSRVWSGMEWRYNPLPAIYFMPIIDQIEIILTTSFPDKTMGLEKIGMLSKKLLSENVLTRAAAVVAQSKDVWRGFSSSDAKICLQAALAAVWGDREAERQVVRDANNLT